MKDTTKTLDHRLHSAFAWVLKRLPERLHARVHKWTGGRLGIGTQIVVGLGGGVLLTLGAVVMALALMRVVSARQTEVNEQHMPGLVGAFDVAQLSADLVRATPRLVAATDLEALDLVRVDVLGTEGALETAVAEVIGSQMAGGTGESEGEVIDQLVESLIAIVTEIHESVNRRLTYRDRLQELDLQLTDLGVELQLEVEQEIDDQYFFINTGLRELGDSPAPVGQRRTLAEIQHYSGLLNFKAYQNEVTALLAQAIAENDLAALQATRERLETALSDVVGALVDIRSRPRASLRELVDRLEDLYRAPEGVFATRSGELEELARAEELVAQSRQTTAELVAQVEGLVDSAEMPPRRMRRPVPAIWCSWASGSCLA